MVTCQYKDVLGPVRTQDSLVLRNGIGRTPIPQPLFHLLPCRHQVDELVLFAPQKAPPSLQMADQGMRTILGNDSDTTYT